MSETLPITPEVNIRKWIFIGVVFGSIFLLIAFFVFMSRGGKTVAGKGFSPDSKQVTIWTVGMDDKMMTELGSKFNTYLGRNDMKLSVANFGSYTDYIDMIPRGMQSSTPPDIVVVPNHGGLHFFDQYVNALGDNIVNFTDFETRFHKLFFEELVYQETIKGDGQGKVIQGLRGVPYGFEPLGIYYNRDLVKQVPTLWKNLPDIVKAPVIQTELETGEEDTSNSIRNTLAARKKAQTLPAFTNVGYGAATPIAPDIIALLSVQKKGPTITGYTNINSTDARTMLEYYLSFRRAPNDLERFTDDFSNTLTTTDLFVRGKIATLIGYPSTYQDIEIAIQRAKQDNTLALDFLKNLRIATVPQEEIDPKKQTNFAKYMYFALSKNGANRNFKKPSNDPVLKFVQFLLTSEAQGVFAKYPQYLLPTENSVLTEGKDNKINPDMEYAMTIGDWYVPGQNFVAYDMGIPHLFRSIIRQALDEPGVTATSVTTIVSSYLSCKVAQLTDATKYAKGCLCQTKLPTNGNNYWPICSQE